MNRKSDVQRSVPAALLGSMGACAALLCAAADLPAVADRPVLEDRYPQRRIEFPGGVIGLADLTYSVPAGFRPLTLDLYRPAAKSKPLPLVIYVHGGGWQSGHTRHSGAFEDWPGVLAQLAARGYVVASLEYRLSGEARFPAPLHDVKSALKWLRAHRDEHGIDPERAVLWGGSAGGQLAALAGMTCGVATLQAPAGFIAGVTEQTAAQVSDCAQGVVAWYGIFDFAALANGRAPDGTASVSADSAPARYLGCGAAACSRAALGAASASSYIDTRDPPVLLIHGVLDRTVPIEQSRSFHTALSAAGITAELLEMPGVDHSFVGSSHESTRAASLRALRETFEFIDRSMGPKP